MKRLSIVLVVLLGLLVGADFAAASFAEHTVSQKARKQLGLSNDPRVTVHGFPFATQAMAGEYDHISISAEGVPVQKLQDVAINAELHDVTAPISELTSGDVSGVSIGRVQGRVKLTESDISRVPPLTNIDDLRIAPASESYVRYGEGGPDSEQARQESGEQGQQENTEKDDATAGVRLSGKADISGDRIEIFAFAMIKLDGTTIRITPHRLQFGNDKETTVVPDAVQRKLLPSFEADINAGDMPFTVTPTAITVAPGALTLQGEARNVSFAGVSKTMGG